MFVNCWDRILIYGNSILFGEIPAILKHVRYEVVPCNWGYKMITVILSAG